MSVQATNEWKIGAFVVGGVTLLILVLFWLGASRLNTPVVQRITYFDESVQGLEVGAPIKIRGVTIGKVIEITLAQDRRLVEVHFEARAKEFREVEAVGVNVSAGGEAPPEMRIVVASQGITGVKFLEADFFPSDTPTVGLAFNAPSNYIPSAPSTLKSLEDALRGLGDEIPLAIRDFRAMAVTIDERMAALDTGALSSSLMGLSDEMRATLAGTSESGIGFDLSGLVADLRSTTQAVDQALQGLTGEAGSLNAAATSIGALAEDMRTSLAKVDSQLDRVDLAAALDSFRGAADSAKRLSDGLGPASLSMPEALRDLRAMMRKIEALASLLERDPSAILRGRG